MEIVSQAQDAVQKRSDQAKNFPQVQKCSFSGSAADFYIGLSGIRGSKNIRIVGAVCTEMVETAIVKLLVQGWEEVKWPVILDLKKKLVYHSYDADKKGTSAIQGWKEYVSKS